MSESHNNEATEGNETMKKATTFHKGDKVLYGQHVYHSVECNDFWGAGLFVGMVSDDKCVVLYGKTPRVESIHGLVAA